MEINPANKVEPLRVRGTSMLFAGEFARAESLLAEAGRLSESASSDWYLAQAIYWNGERARAEAMLGELARSRRTGQVERRS